MWLLRNEGIEMTECAAYGSRIPQTHQEPIYDEIVWVEVFCLTIMLYYLCYEQCSDIKMTVCPAYTTTHPVPSEDGWK